MNRDPSKRQKLEALRDEILRLPEAWLFPPEGSVQGFMGTSPVMFVAERPSTAKEFSGPGKSFLYPLLEETDNGNGHLTDVIKTRGKVGQSYPEEIAPHRDFFDREIEILQPRLIVAFGQKVYDLLQFALASQGIKIRQVWHYAYAARWPRKRAAFKRQLREALGDDESYRP
jgi:uracil-DNA glycosylase